MGAYGLLRTATLELFQLPHGFQGVVLILGVSASPSPAPDHPGLHWPLPLPRGYLVWRGVYSGQTEGWGGLLPFICIAFRFVRAALD